MVVSCPASPSHSSCPQPSNELDGGSGRACPPLQEASSALPLDASLETPLAAIASIEGGFKGEALSLPCLSVGNAFGVSIRIRICAPELMHIPIDGSSVGISRAAGRLVRGLSCVGLEEASSSWMDTLGGESVWIGSNLASIAAEASGSMRSGDVGLTSVLWLDSGAGAWTGRGPTGSRGLYKTDASSTSTGRGASSTGTSRSSTASDDWELSSSWLGSWSDSSCRPPSLCRCSLASALRSASARFRASRASLVSLFRASLASRLSVSSSRTFWSPADLRASARAVASGFRLVRSSRVSETVASSASWGLSEAPVLTLS